MFRCRALQSANYSIACTGRKTPMYTHRYVHTYAHLTGISKRLSLPFCNRTLCMQHVSYLETTHYLIHKKNKFEVEAIYLPTLILYFLLKKHAFFISFDNSQFISFSAFTKWMHYDTFFLIAVYNNNLQQPTTTYDNNLRQQQLTTATTYNNNNLRQQLTYSNNLQELTTATTYDSNLHTATTYKNLRQQQLTTTYDSNLRQQLTTATFDSNLQQQQLTTTAATPFHHFTSIHLIQKRLSSELLQCALRIDAYPDRNAPWM